HKCVFEGSSQWLDIDDSWPSSCGGCPRSAGLRLLRWRSGMAKGKSTQEENRQQHCEKEIDTPMHFAKGPYHWCGFLSWGGSPFPEIHRRSSRGQKATEPGKIKTRKPTLLPTEHESIRLTPTVTKAKAKPSPSAP